MALVRLPSLAVALCLLACGAPSPLKGPSRVDAGAPPDLAPAEPSDSAAFGSDDAPLVVDWPAERRAALEALLRKGNVIAATAEASGVRFLSDCALPGTYTYEPTKPREELLRPGVLEVGVVRLGRYTTPLRTLYTRDLAPPCRTATHFVKSITAGAFAVRNRPVVFARDATDVFDDEHPTARAGDIDACKAKVDPRSPPAGCRAPVQIEIVALDPRSEAQARCETGSNDGCVKWASEVFDGKSVDPAAAQVFLGKAVALCHAGKASGCVLASAGAKHDGAPKIDLRDVADRGCRLENWSSCLDLAHLLAADGNARGAFDALETACTKGDSGCNELGDAIEKSPPKTKDQWQTLADVRAHACLFTASECDKYAVLRRGGFVAKGDFPSAGKRVEDCDSFGDCYIAAAAEALGIGITRDVARARKSFERFCTSPEASITFAGKKCELPRGWQ